MTTGRFLRWRRLAGAAQAAVWLGLPFVEMGGESALRLDVGSARLHAFGASFALGEAWAVLLATLALTFAFLAVTLVAGRVWCGWGCPQTVLGDLTRWVEPDRRRKPRRWRRPLGFALTAAVSLLVGASLVWYFLPPLEFLRGLASGTLHPAALGAFLSLSVLLFLDLAFLRATFCATACPYAKLQGVLFDRHTLRVAYDARRDADCVDCDACVRVCPTGIDIRDGLQMECIACALCIDACTPIMAKLRRPPHLVGYFHGQPEAEPGRGPVALPGPRPFRPAALALWAATLGLGFLLAVLAANRPLLTVDAMADAAVPSRRTADGRVLSAFAVALENRGRAHLQVALAMQAAGSALLVSPAEVELAPGERRQVRLVTTARGLPSGVAAGELVAEARRAGETRASLRTRRVLSLWVPPERTKEP
jgi:cytochrome c oxidase accessory protein FixG